MKKLLLVLSCFLSLFTHAQWLLIGTYTSGKSEGIYVYDFNAASGGARYQAKIKAPNPSYLAVSPDGKNVYAAFEQGEKNGGGKIAAYAFNRENGSLQFINEQPSGGDDPCFVSTDKTGRWLAAANYSGGSLALFRIGAAGGITADTVIQHHGSSTNKERQEKAHVHSSFFSPDNHFLLTPDLGMDKVMIYAFNPASGHLRPAAQPFVEMKGGSGPRHLVFSPNQHHLYLIQELTGEVVAYRYAAGKLTAIQHISAAAPGFRGFMGSADIHVSADGKFLYCSNRGDANTLTIFRINGATGMLSVAGYQSTMGVAPRNFTLDPSGNYLLVANQNSDNIIIFKRNKTTGLLTATGNSISVGNPVCLKWIEK